MAWFMHAYICIPWPQWVNRAILIMLPFISILCRLHHHVKHSQRWSGGVKLFFSASHWLTSDLIRWASHNQLFLVYWTGHQRNSHTESICMAGPTIRKTYYVIQWQLPTLNDAHKPFVTTYKYFIHYPEFQRHKKQFISINTSFQRELWRIMLNVWIEIRTKSWKYLKLILINGRIPCSGRWIKCSKESKFGIMDEKWMAMKMECLG